jgi:RNA polymerase sigma-70 factor (ECF subfamily)
VKELPGSAADDLPRARSGDPVAFTALVRKYQRLVYSLALRMLSDRYKAEDLAQEVFMQLHRNIASIESNAHLPYWLRRTTIHRAIDRMRREPRYEAVPLEEDSLATEAVTPDPLLERRLQMLVEKLPPTPRAVVLLRYQEDLDPTEIAQTMSMSINTVKSHLKRSLAALRASALATGIGAPEEGLPAVNPPRAKGRHCHE